MGQRHTLVHQLADWAERNPDTHAIHGKDAGGTWQHYTWAEYWRRSLSVGKGLLALGHEVGDCVAIVGSNRAEWVFCEFGIMAVRGVPAPIYTTLTHDQVAYIVDHSKSKIAICDDQTQLEKYLKASEEGLVPAMEKIITMDRIESQDERIMALDDLIALGDEQDDTEIDKRMEELTEDETALLIYTSGTTGLPKAVQLDQGGMVYMAEALTENMPLFRQPENYRSVSYLPLCHVAEQLFTNFLHLSSGGQVYFCADLKQIKDHLVEVRPTMFLGVPRVWEKFQAALETKLGEAGPPKSWLVNWARNTELAAFKKEMETGQPQQGFARNLANSLAISKVKGALGLDQLMVAATGAAPISQETLEFFASLGICIYEGYGMSETTGVSTCSEYGKPRFGTVGKALNGVQIKIAEDDEILLKGRNMTRGYLHQPEKTAELIDDEGWLHTGDLGALDDEGYLKITGRKKDIIITAGGKNIAPAEMEGYIKGIAGVAHAVVVGDRQPYLTALVVLDVDDLDGIAKRIGIEPGTLEDYANNEKVQKWVQEQVEKNCNSKVAKYQTIKKTKLLPVNFTVDSGEVTPTMKIKRNVVNKKYADEILAIYEG